MDRPLLNEKRASGSAWNEMPAARPARKYNRIVGRFLPAILLTSAVLLLFRTAGQYHAGKGFEDFPDARPTPGAIANGKVALEAHIMSKCPDARDCLQQLVVPTMEQISDKVEFTLSFIGRVDDKSDVVTCMHGPSECLGNIIELCAADIYPDPKLYLGFANCMTANYSQIPERDFVQNCALEHGIDFDRVNRCISEEGHGSELLRSSVLRSQEMNVTKSCTVRLAGQIRCIRDGGKWYDCPGGSEVADLVRDIERLYNGDDDTR